MNDIFNEALKCLSAKGCSTTELASILESKFSSISNIDEIIEKTIARLEELHLINDTFFANSVAQRHQHKGDRFIVQKLQQKGFDGSVIDSALKSLPSEFERALPEARKKRRTLHSLEPMARDNKMLRFLSSRGFNSSTCYQIIDELKSEVTV